MCVWYMVNTNLTTCVKDRVVITEQTCCQKEYYEGYYKLHAAFMEEGFDYRVHVESDLEGKNTYENYVQRLMICHIGSKRCFVLLLIFIIKCVYNFNGVAQSME